jgi:acylphosphatase
MDPMRLKLKISGRVQGVCYRWYTRDTAAELGLTGWVRNLPDGTVELVAEGARGKLEQLLDCCRRGPDLARVSDIQTEWEDETGEFQEFSIRH